MTIANSLTLLRLFLTPVILLLLFSQPEQYAYVVIALLLITAASDMLDGFFARRSNTASIFGVYLDTIIDKILALSCLLALTQIGLIPLWIFSVFLIRELFVTYIRGLVSEIDVTISAGQWGKFKTASLTLGLVTVLIWPRVGMFFFLVAVVLAAISLVQYTIAFYNAWSENKSESDVGHKTQQTQLWFTGAIATALLIVLMSNLLYVDNSGSNSNLLFLLILVIVEAVFFQIVLRKKFTLSAKYLSTGSHDIFLILIYLSLPISRDLFVWVVILVMSSRFGIMGVRSFLQSEVNNIDWESYLKYSALAFSFVLAVSLLFAEMGWVGWEEQNIIFYLLITPLLIDIFFIFKLMRNPDVFQAVYSGLTGKQWKSDSE